MTLMLQLTHLENENLHILFFYILKWNKLKSILIIFQRVKACFSQLAKQSKLLEMKGDFIYFVPYIFSDSQSKTYD